MENREPGSAPAPVPIGDGAEGYEGERLHQLFLGGSQLAGSKSRQQAEPEQSEADDITVTVTEPERPESFDPFFTVIENVDTGEQHHPHVHYVFSDDDPDVLTNALLDTLSTSPRTGQSADRNPSNRAGSPTVERCVVVDMDTTGQTISSAKSLSHKWQVSDVQVAPAPTFDELATDEVHGSMLRITGTHTPQLITRTTPGDSFKRAQERHGKDSFAALKSLANEFHSEMDLLLKTAQSSDAKSAKDIKEPG